MKALLVVAGIVGVSMLIAWNSDEIKEIRRETEALKKKNDADRAALAKHGIHIKH